LRTPGWPAFEPHAPIGGYRYAVVELADKPAILEAVEPGSADS
jgi:hypothetical protein